MFLRRPDLMPALPFEHRAWDTQHFGYPVASISNPEMESEALERSLLHAQKQGYQLVYWASCQELDTNSPCLQEFQGMLVDRKTTFAKSFRSQLATQDDAQFRSVEWQPGDHSAELMELGVAAGLWSRFAIDPRIPRDKFLSLYEIWMLRSIARELCDTVLVVQEKDGSVPLGMVTVLMDGDLGQIGLIAVSEQQRGRGLGRRLVEAADRWMLERGAKSAQVVTQLQNVAACRLYENAGYKIEKIEYLYHFWIPARVQAISA
jgi:dTDP-4-amino-4,6-dideoxy-D-galactose acyltransferase